MRGKKWLILLAGLALVLLANGTGVTGSSFIDQETSSDNILQAWTPNQWLQTTQAHFEAGVLYQVDTTTSSGDVKLDSMSSPAAVTDTFADETKIASKTNLVVTGGQVQLTSSGGGTETLRPTAAGDETLVSSQYPSSGEHWDKVNEVSSDDDSTYVYSGDYSWEEDLYNIADHSVGSGAINYIKVYMVCRATTSPSQSSAYTHIKTGGVEDNGTQETVTTSYATYSYQWDDNPQTGNPWTWDEIDALQIGVGLRRPNSGGMTQYTRCTQVYVEVSYSYYDSPGTLTSTNLLSGETVNGIDSFDYNASSIPSGTSLKVQFSQDSSNWYNSAGTLGGWDTLSQGINSIDLSGLGWSGANFYYQMEFTSDGTATPVLDEISVNFVSGYYSSGTIASQVLDTGIAGATWNALFWDETLESGTNITFEVRASDTLFAKDDATPSWIDLGLANSPITSGLPSGRYMQWQATLTTSDTSKTPTLHEVRVYYY